MVCCCQARSRPCMPASALDWHDARHCLACSLPRKIWPASAKHEAGYDLVCDCQALPGTKPSTMLIYSTIYV